MGFFPGNDHTEGCWFDIKEGLYTPIRPLHTLVLAPEEAELLNRMLLTPVTELHTIALNRQQRVDFLNAMLTYFGYHRDGINAVQSVRILREVF